VASDSSFSVFVLRLVGWRCSCIRLAVGNNSGKVYVWEVDGSAKHPETLKAPGCTATIRQTVFSPDGRTIVYCCDDASIWRWDQASK
jgi:WD40 repeat protein